MKSSLFQTILFRMKTLVGISDISVQTDIQLGVQYTL